MKTNASEAFKLAQEFFPEIAPDSDPRVKELQQAFMPAVFITARTCDLKEKEQALQHLTNAYLTVRLTIKPQKDGTESD